MNATGVRGVLFDAGNTLVRVRGSVGTVYAEIAERHGVQANAQGLERLFRRAFDQRKDSFLESVSGAHSPESERAWWKALVRGVFGEAGVLPRFGLHFDDFFAELYRAFEHPARWEVFPDVVPCLDALADRGIPSAVVSNWDSRLHAVLAGLGLARRFRFVLTSAEFGAEKPHPSIFREAASRLGLRPEQVLHVGDLIRDDWLGARRAGLQAVLVARGGTCPAGVRCVTELGGLDRFVAA